jgi:hypothetical protein
MDCTVTAFLGDAIVASGERGAVTRDLEHRYPDDHGAIVVIDDATGAVTDLDYWDALAACRAPARGRPRLGVQAREVTLLPRHWAWLAAQPRGASATLRRLVDEAQREQRGARGMRQDAAYRFMQAICGDRPGYEEALRALYQGDAARFDAAIAAWPEDVRTYLARLAGGHPPAPAARPRGPGDESEREIGR